MFDKDNNGFIGPEELRETMKELGMCLSEADLAAMMDTAGCHIPNRIYYEGQYYLRCRESILNLFITKANQGLKCNVVICIFSKESCA